MNIFKNIYKQTMPFIAIGIAFIILGLILKDDNQLYFSLVWILIGFIAAILRTNKLRRSVQ